jgi:hypothetical protein
MSILSPILFSIEKEDKKSTTDLALVYASPVISNLFSKYNQTYTRLLLDLSISHRPTPKTV